MRSRAASRSGMGGRVLRQRQPAIAVQAGRQAHAISIKGLCLVSDHLPMLACIPAVLLAVQLDIRGRRWKPSRFP